ncbi:MAG: hypothetical protein AAB013_06560 [Planctomycetota bacterium]
MRYFECSAANNEHKKKEKIGILSAVLVNSILLSDIILATQQPIAAKRHRNLIKSALNGKKERIKK